MHSFSAAFGAERHGLTDSIFLGPATLILSQDDDGAFLACKISCSGRDLIRQLHRFVRQFKVRFFRLRFSFVKQYLQRSSAGNRSSFSDVTDNYSDFSLAQR